MYRPRTLLFSRLIGRKCGRMSTRHFSCSPKCSSAPVTGASQQEVESAQQYCVNLLRKYDRPSYTLSTFIPRGALKFYVSLHALNVTLSMIPDTTSAQTVGRMRLQFWRDAITKILAGTPPKEPVAVLFASALDDLNVRTHGRARINKRWLTRLIDTREQHLTNVPYTSMHSLEMYAENTYSTLLYLTLAAIPLTSLAADHLASHIGKAAGISSVLRGLPMVAFPHPQRSNPGRAHSAGGSVILPLDVMAETGVREEDVFRYGADADGLRDAVFTVATRASDHLITARQMLKNLRMGEDLGHDFEHADEEGHEYGPADADKPGQASLDEVRRGFGVFMPAVGTSLWLERLQKEDFNIFDPKLRTTDWRLPWKSYWAFQRGMF